MDDGSTYTNENLQQFSMALDEVLTTLQSKHQPHSIIQTAIKEVAALKERIDAGLEPAVAPAPATAASIANDSPLVNQTPVTGGIVAA